MTTEEALAFVCEHGVVLASAQGPIPRLSEAVAGGPIQGGWWSHPAGRDIFRIISVLSTYPDVLVCRVVGGKVSLVHRRLWPALIRAAARFPVADLARTGQEHTARGHHVRHDLPFPQWADAESLALAETLSEAEALAALGDWARVEH